VEVDRSQIEQVMVNLYLNAWQAMGQGGTIHVKIDNVTLDKNFVRPYEAAPGKYVRVSVMDTGTGMDEETQKRVFEPFFTTRSMGRGTGMGLASAFGIIKNHSGIIKFTSSLGKGTAFCIYLPATDHIVEKENAVKENVQIGRETILIVDDEQYVLDACEAMLTRLGYNIILTGSGDEAVERFRRDKDDIDLIILDMVMPGMDGPATYQHLIAIDPEVKVILSSGYSITNIAKEILDMGCDKFVQKPFRLGQISQIIRELLDDRPES
jgi:CheY-like chemotaxis protein